MSHLTEEFLRKRSSQIIQDKAKHITIFNKDAEKSFPTFHPSEIVLGPVLGKGGFCTVSEVSKVNYKPTPEESISNLELEESPFVGLQNKRFISERFIRQGKARYAIKKVTDGAYKKGDPHFFVSSTIDLAMEVKFLAVLRHNHIIKMRALADVPYTSKDFFIVMDRLSETLDDRIEKVWTKAAKKRLVPKEEKEELLCDRLAVAFDICSALDFMHQRKIIYRDLKPENLGFDVRDDVKLFDFGLSAELQPAAKVPGSNPATYKLTGETGSFRYMAPEVALSLPYNQRADVYGFGVLLSYIVELNQPYKGYTHVKMMQKVYKGKDRPSIGKTCPPLLKDLLSKMWNAKIEARPELDDVLSVLEKVIMDLSGGDGSLLDMTNRTNKSING